MNKKDLAKFESLKKWFEKKLEPYVLDNTVTVMYDSEDAGFVSMGFECSDTDWDITLHTSSGNIYSIANFWDCEDMNITNIKDDIKERIEVMKLIDWSK